MTRPSGTASPFLRPDLDRLAARLPANPLTRFAPSPTGHLHLGHVLHAIYVWGLARALGGRVLLRIEDHDRERSRPDYEASILADLAWLGLEPDTDGGSWGLRQSDRPGAYEAAAARLRSQGLIYACACSRREIAEGRSGQGDELRYPGTCRSRGLSEQGQVGLRVVMDAGLERFDDGLHGPQVQEPAAQSGDLLVRDRRGFWTYQFAVAVDDVDQQVDLVVRGVDLLPSTGRQLRLARLLGRSQPAAFVHHPLLYGDSGAKLSKSNRDVGVAELRAAGVGPSRVLGMAAAAAGLIDEPHDLSTASLAGLMSNE